MTEIRIGQLDLRDLSTSNLGSANAVASLESNIVSTASTVNTAINTVSSNADTLVTSLNTVSSNIDSAATLVSTVSSNASTFSDLVTSFTSYGNTNFATGTYIDAEVANVIASAPTALDTLQEISTAINNDASFFTSISGLADTVNDNTTAIPTSIDGVQSNLDSYATYANSQFGAASNISLTVGNTAISNTTIFLEGARSSITLATNTDSKSITFSHAMGNATSQETTMDGSVNTISLSSAATSNTNMYFVFYNGLALKPDEYTISGSTMTLSNVEPIISGSNVEVRYLDFFGFRESASGGAGAYSFQGESFGYNISGEGPTSGNVIDKFSFTSDANATDVGDLTQVRWAGAGQTSLTHGYFSGGISPASSDVIDKFPFSSDTNATDVGELPSSGSGAGQSSSTHGYHTTSSTIYKFSFADESSTATVGSLSQNRGSTRGQNSDVYGYTSGGADFFDTIDKFPFSSDTNATDVGELTIGGFKGGGTGQSSETYGYNTDNRNPSISPTSDVIEKFSFSSDANATDVGELSRATAYSIGTSSTNSGYASGGDGAQTTIEKFPFASDTSATNIGNRTVGYGNGAGAQI